MTKKGTKKSPKKTEQLKIAGTGRTDAIDEIDRAGETYREARDARMEYQEDELAAQEALTAALKKHGRTEYVYDGADGRQYRAYVAEAKAKVKRVTEKKPKAE